MLLASLLAERDAAVGSLIASEARYRALLAWTCNGRQKCRIDIVETRMVLILLAAHLRRNSSGRRSKISAKSMVTI
jgi:hypothetical protein